MRGRGASCTGRRSSRLAARGGDLIPLSAVSDVFACQGISRRDPEIGPAPEPAALHGSLCETACQALTTSDHRRTGIIPVRAVSEVFACQGISRCDPEIGPAPEPAALHGSLCETPCQALTTSGHR